MELYSLDEMMKGWFVGKFSPSALSVDGFEVGIKRYKSGDYEASHFHKISTEVTVIIEGQARMNDIIHGPGSIIVLKPSESTDFLAITDVVTAVVKCPSAPNDKYLSASNA